MSKNAVYRVILGVNRRKNAVYKGDAYRYSRVGGEGGEGGSKSGSFVWGTLPDGRSMSAR